MFSRLTCALALTAALTTSGFAQTAETEELDLGTPVTEGPQVGDEYAKETFGDWIIRCVKTEDGNDPCSLYQLLVNETGQSVAEFTMLPLNNGGEAKAGATVVAPLQTLLTEGMRLSIDGSQTRQYAFQFCNAVGCVVRFGLTEDFVTQFKRGAAATVQIVPANAPDSPVSLKVSLSGFTAAFDSLDK